MFSSFYSKCVDLLHSARNVIVCWVLLRTKLVYQFTFLIKLLIDFPFIWFIKFMIKNALTHQLSSSFINLLLIKSFDLLNHFFQVSLTSSSSNLFVFYFFLFFSHLVTWLSSPPLHLRCTLLRLCQWELRREFFTIEFIWDDPQNHPFKVFFSFLSRSYEK